MQPGRIEQITERVLVLVAIHPSPDSAALLSGCVSIGCLQQTSERIEKRPPLILIEIGFGRHLMTADSIEEDHPVVKSRLIFELGKTIGGGGFEVGFQVQAAFGFVTAVAIEALCLKKAGNLFPMGIVLSGLWRILRGEGDQATANDGDRQTDAAKRRQEDRVEYGGSAFRKRILAALPYCRSAFPRRIMAALPYCRSAFPRRIMAALLRLSRVSERLGYGKAGHCKYLAAAEPAKNRKQEGIMAGSEIVVGWR